LGINAAGMIAGSRHVEGVVEMMLNATQRHSQPLTKKRLLGWHAALFPTGYSGPYKIETGKYRTGIMQVVSGAMGREKLHYEAVPPERVKDEMKQFLKWFNTDNSMDPVLKAAVAHFRFIIIHPFDDGNGRIARALTDMLLARAEGTGERFYSMSARILTERKEYYRVLNRVQHSTGDITEWIDWFLHCLKNAILLSENASQQVLRKADFWKKHEHTTFNERQRLMLNKLWDGIEGNLQTSKWAKMARTSNDTALRDIRDLVEKGILKPSDGGGRSVHYRLNGRGRE
jgi:Fic family protein